MQFRDLAQLRLFLRGLLDRQVESLSTYYDNGSGGFYHRHDEREPGKLSRSSTATCVLSLVATNQWKNGPWQASTEKLVDSLLREPWTSAALPRNNVFTVAFILEAVTELSKVNATGALDTDAQAKIEKARQKLTSATLRAARSKLGLSVQGYPPSAYVTQLAIRTLQKQPTPLDEEVRRSISDWSEHEINRQVTLLAKRDKTGDVFQLAYSVILLTSLVKPDRITPAQEFITEAALEEFFSLQRDDGTWPLSRPLFHYPTVGSAHCFDYEMLVQLLSERRLVEKLLRFIPKLARAAEALKSWFPLGSKGAGWSSGHHPQFQGPESWSTASVYHFCHAFERLIAEQIRLETFSYLGSPYTVPTKPSQYDDQLPGEFLDCVVHLDGQSASLKKAVSDHILKPLIAAEQDGIIESGRPLPRNVPVSVLLFGPPGTSKTKLAEIIAARLGWPALSIDASHFIRNGMDGVYAEADQIFGMLAVAERILVLLDEFDEMVRERGIATDVLSRFLTAAMLPKLHKINDNRSLVFVVATNHIEAFDVAIKRPGRFDVILQVMPPTADEKLSKQPGLLNLADEHLSEVDLRQQLDPLTFLETEFLRRKLATAPTAAAKHRLLKSAYEGCTLRSKTKLGNDEEEKEWSVICKEQSRFSRVM